MRDLDKLKSKLEINIIMEKRMLDTCQYMWPLTRKLTERLTVLKRIAVPKPFISCSNRLACGPNASSYLFTIIHHPFQQLKLSVQKKSSAVRTAWAIRLRKFISRLNGSSSPFKINHQLFEQLELSVQEIHQLLEGLKLSVRESNSSAVWMARAKNKQ